MGWQEECNVEWNKWESNEDVDIFFKWLAHPLFRLPTLASLFCSFVHVSWYSRLKQGCAAQILMNCSLYLGVLSFPRFFIVFGHRGRHTAGMTLSLQRQTRRGRRFRTFRLAVPWWWYARSCRKNYLNGSKSLRREHAAQLDTCPADTKRSCMYEFPLSNSGESNAMLENSTFAPPKPHFRTTARRTEHHKSAR